MSNLTSFDLSQLRPCPNRGFVPFEEFDELFEIQPNPFANDDSVLMLETYGEEYQAVLDADPHTVWTVVECDRGMFIVAGFQHVDRVGYLITKEKWTPEIESMDVDIEFHAHDEDDDIDD